MERLPKRDDLIQATYEHILSKHCSLFGQARQTGTDPERLDVATNLVDAFLLPVLARAQHPAGVEPEEATRERVYDQGEPSESSESRSEPRTAPRMPSGTKAPRDPSREPESPPNGSYTCSECGSKEVSKHLAYFYCHTCGTTTWKPFRSSAIYERKND